MPEGTEEQNGSPRRGRVTYVASGRARPPSITIDFDAQEIRTARQSIAFRDVEIIDVKTNVVAISDGEHWISFDALRYGSRTDGALGRLEPLLRDGSLSASFSQELYDLRDAVERARQSSPAGPRRVRFSFRSIVRVDYHSIILAFAGLAVFVWFYSGKQGQNLLESLDTVALWVFFVGLGLAVAILYGARWFYRATFDEEGIRVRRLWGTRFLPWSDVTGVRQQGLELELEGRKSRLGFNLDLLRIDGAPLVVRRGVRATATPLGLRFLDWVRSRAPSLPEIPVFGTRLERMTARIWILVVAGINGYMFWLSWPQPFNQHRFGKRLIELGARTSDAWDPERFFAALLHFEFGRVVDLFPWRFFTALFLHGDIMHLAVNMLVLATVMGWIIRVFGLVRGTIIYVASGFFGNAIAHMGFLARLTGQNPANLSVGASTALMGIVGALLGAVYSRPLSVPLAVRGRFRWAIPVFVLITMGSGMAISFIDNDSHLGGFVAGFVLAWIIRPKRRRAEASGGAGPAATATA